MAESEDNFNLDDFQKEQLRQLLGADDDINEEAIVFSDDAVGLDTFEDDDYAYSGDESGSDDESENDQSKKFKTLADLGFSDEEADQHNSDNESDDEFTFRNALREVRNFKTKSKPKKNGTKKGGLAALRRKIRRTEMGPEIKLLLSKANEAFVKNDLDEALKIYSEVIKLDKNNFSAYKTLGEIYRLNGDLNKCSNIWLLAAHINAWDIEFWKTVAEISVELGHYRQAIYCYRRAISASHKKDYEAIFARASLYREIGKYKRATVSLLNLRVILPHESKIVRELAKVYVDEQRVNDAISLYTKILDDNVKHRKLTERGENVDLNNITFDWSELNILSELYTSKGAWSLGIKTMRQVSRWIQGREKQLFWDDNLSLDIEFDERKFDFPKFQNLKQSEREKDYSLPIDIRVQMGLFRLNLKEEEEALNHFRVLLEQPIEETPDLFHKVGMELESYGVHQEALEFLIPLSYYEDYNTSDLVLAIAKCLRETEDFDNAKEAYARLLEYDPDNIELKVSLAECCFYLNDVEEAEKLYKEARKQRSREKETSRGNLLSTAAEFLEGLEDQKEEEDDDEELFHQPAIIEELNITKKSKSKKRKVVISAEEVSILETKSEIRVKKQYEKTVKLMNKIEEIASTITDKPSESVFYKTMATMWIEVASDLIEIFSMYRVFFTNEKARKFYLGLRKRTAKLSVDHKLSRMKYLQNEIILSAEMNEVPAEIFRGLTYDQWYDLFINYALMIAEFEKDNDIAIGIQDIAKQVNVFKGKELITNLVGLSIGIITNDQTVSLNQARILMNDHQFCSETLKTYLASCDSSCAHEYFADPPAQKFILRQVKAFDALKENADISGMASITNRNVDVSKDHFIINYIYASYMYTNKSYYSSLVYFLKLYKNYNKNPSLLFLMALSNLYRSVQRKTLNTNFQILQGLSFMLEYIKTKDMKDPYCQMEAYYNLGRSFQMLGLDSIAIEFYEKVLNINVDDKTYDLSKEAAHNMYIIYNLNRNHKLAEDIMDRYLVI